MDKKIWSITGGSHYLSYPSVEQEKLENAVYRVHVDAFGRFFLVKVADKFKFDYKLYGLENKLINRILKTYSHVDGNLGVLLNGLKGTGKTVSGKIICNQLNQPTIIVKDAYDGVEDFLNSIPQDITIFVDEYEKIFGESTALLTIMDGALNSIHRRVFILTTNNLYVDSNLLQRPSRVRYLRKFEDLAPEVVEEIVDDILQHKELKDECIKFISSLELITVDVVKSILEEVNIHAESPFDFSGTFNIKISTDKYKISQVEEDGKLRIVADHVEVYPRPKYDNSKGRYVEINNTSIGRITKVIGPDTIEVTRYKDYEQTEVAGKIVLRIEPSYAYHSNYAYQGGGGYGYGENLNEAKVSEEFIEYLKETRVEEPDEDDMEVGYDEVGEISEGVEMMVKNTTIVPAAVGKAMATIKPIEKGPSESKG